MQMVTAVVLAFIFVGLAFPHLVKRRQPFYAALGLVLVIVLLDGVTFITSTATSFPKFVYFINAILEVTAIVLLVLSVGGQSLGELAGEMGKSIDAVRYGNPTSPAPTSSIPPATAGPTAGPAPAARPPAPGAAQAPVRAKNIALPPRKPRDDSSIPMD